MFSLCAKHCHIPPFSWLKTTFSKIFLVSIALKADDYANITEIEQNKVVLVDLIHNSKTFKKIKAEQ
jgi:hypothetical protein